MKLIALVTEPKSVTRFLRHLGEPTDAPAMSAAREPPYFTSCAVRRALGGIRPTQATFPWGGEAGAHQPSADAAGRHMR